MSVTASLFIDFNNNGDYAAAYDDVSARVRRAPGITCSRGRDQVRQLAPPAAGALNADLDNQSRDYSTSNAGSPLAGLLYPGHAVQLRAGIGSLVGYEAAVGYESATPYNGLALETALWTGILDDLPQHPERDSRSVSIPCLGTLSRLRSSSGSNIRISTALYQSIRTDQALGYLLDAVGWPAADRVLDTGKTTLNWWWLQDADPFAAMVEILASEGAGAAIYEDTLGRIVFESRHYRLLTARCTTAQATIRDTGAEPLHSAPFAINPGLKDVVNVCTVEVKTRSAKTLAAVWSLGSTLTLAPNELRRVIATSNDPFTAAVAPVLATDYTVTAGSLVSVTLDRTSGASCTITLTAGASGATVTGLQLRAQAVTVDNTVQVTNNIDTTTSQARYGKRTYPLAARAEIELNVAQDFANAVVGYYQEPRTSLSVTVRGGATERLTQCLSREVSDRIHIVEAQSGFDNDVFIEQIALATDGSLLTAVFGCETADSPNYGTWGASTYSSGLWGF